MAYSLTTLTFSERNERSIYPSDTEWYPGISRPFLLVRMPTIIH